MKFWDHFEIEILFNIRSLKLFRMVKFRSSDANRVRKFGSQKNGQELSSSLWNAHKQLPQNNINNFHARNLTLAAIKANSGEPEILTSLKSIILKAKKLLQYSCSNFFETLRFIGVLFCIFKYVNRNSFYSLKCFY
jgi:hypothetical protein